MNTLAISGNLTRDPETKQVGDTTVTSLRLAWDERRLNKTTDEWESVPHYFDVDVWGARGENVARKCSQGSLVYVEGSLKYRQWEAEDGSTRSAVSIKAKEVSGPDFFKPKSEDRELVIAGAGATSGGTESATENDDIPF